MKIIYYRIRVEKRCLPRGGRQHFWNSPYVIANELYVCSLHISLVFVNLVVLYNCRLFQCYSYGHLNDSYIFTKSWLTYRSRSIYVF